jgi:putative cardiolipin synthase
VRPACAAYHGRIAVFAGDLAERHPMHSRIECFAFVVLSLAGGISACGGLPQVERRESHALADQRESRLEQLVSTRLEARPGQTGAWPLAEGADAFGARVGLARAAARTLDVQYYIFEPDNSGFAFLAELLAAADRGVRVRLLLDDIHTAGLERVLTAVAIHPNIEVRLFNPFAHGRARWLDALFDFRRVSRRMHNKSMTADNAVTIVGGRNIGGEYFGVKPDLDFSDLDLLTIGAVVAQVSGQFDQYWNSRQVYPIEALARAPPDGAASLRAVRGEIARAAIRYPPVQIDPGQNKMARAIVEGQLPVFFWGTGTVIADPPAKVVLPPQDSERHAANSLLGLLGQAGRDLVLVSPYFVPGKRGVAWLHGLVRRGVRVRVITNSFAATDVRAVHGGYARYRKDLLRAGVVLYEMKPSAHSVLARETRRSSMTGSSRSSLHAKTYMTDRRVVYVGSFNLDYRSARLNTEMGVVVENEALCARLYEDFVSRILDVAYRVELVRDADGGERLAWITREGEREVRYDREPGVGFFQKIYLGVLQLLPIEEQL